MKIASKILSGLVVAGGLMVSSAYASPVSVEFKNTSEWTIHHIYLSPTSENEWGPDQLGEKETDVIAPGTKFTLNQINPNKYDIKIVDEDGDECVIADVKLGSDKEVDISSENLLNCQSESAQNKEE